MITEKKKAEKKAESKKEKKVKTVKKTKKKNSGKQETIMIICAHPDDEVLGAGGTIAKYVAEGKRVITVIFSYGEASHWWMKKKYTVEMRVSESKEAGKILGIEETIFLGLKDFDLKNLVQKEETIDLLQKVFMRYYPDKVFTHSPDDIIYQDHKAVWDAVEKVTERLHYKGEIYVFNVWGHDVRVSKNPKLFVDISDTFKLKKKALECFRSQRIVMLQLKPGVYWKAFKTGRLNGTRYAERFVKIK